MSGIALGTVQFGLDYGISNPDGRTPEQEVRKILECARKGGIDTYDTSPAYGDCESILGRLLPSNSKVITKVSALPDEQIGSTALQAAEVGFSQSLQALAVPGVYALLAHSANDLLKPGASAFWDWMQSQKEQGKADKIGASVYDPQQLESVLSVCSPDIVQIPFNILDQRWIRGGHLGRLKDRGVEVHGRSVFLQGLLLMNPETLPAHFRLFETVIREFHHLAKDLSLSALALSLGFALGQPEVDKILIGVNSLRQLSEALAVPPLNIGLERLEALHSEDSRLLNPSEWKV